LGFGRAFFGMNELYRPAVFGITAAIAFVVIIYSTRKVIGNTCIEGFIATFDNVDMPGHGKEALPDCVVLIRRALRPYRRLFASLTKALRQLKRPWPKALRVLRTLRAKILPLGKILGWLSYKPRLISSESTRVIIN
jgi:hypothetical protein